MTPQPFTTEDIDMSALYAEMAFEAYREQESEKFWLKHQSDCAKLSELGIVCEIGCAPRFKIDLSIPF